MAFAIATHRLLATFEIVTVFIHFVYLAQICRIGSCGCSNEIAILEYYIHTGQSGKSELVVNTVTIPNVANNLFIAIVKVHMSEFDFAGGSPHTPSWAPVWGCPLKLHYCTTKQLYLAELPYLLL